MRKRITSLPALPLEKHENLSKYSHHSYHALPSVRALVSEISFKARCLRDGFILEIKEKKVVSVKVDPKMYKWVNNAWRENGFASRSDFLRAIINAAISDEIDKSVFRENGEFWTTPAEKTLTFKLERKVLEKLDEKAREYGYGNRSDFIRSLIEYFMKKTM